MAEIKKVLATSVKKGTSLVIDGVACSVTSVQTSRPGKHGHAKCRIEAVSLIDSKKKIIVVPGHDKLDSPIIEKKNAQVLSVQDGKANVMDSENYEQLALPAEIVGESKGFMKDGLDMKLQLVNDKPVGVVLPPKMEFEVTEAPPGVKGDSATGKTMLVTLETGAQIQAPLFVKAGDVLRVNTETGEYVERV